MSVPFAVLGNCFLHFSYESGDQAAPLRAINLFSTQTFPLVPDALGKVWLRIEYTPTGKSFLTRIPLDVSMSTKVKLDLGAMEIINDVEPSIVPSTFLNLGAEQRGDDDRCEPSELDGVRACDGRVRRRSSGPRPSIPSTCRASTRMTASRIIRP